jgi:Uma2 family endonuclease
MAEASEKKHYSEEEYLAQEIRALYKSEYHNGEVFAMSGGSSHHSIIGANISRRILEGIDDKDCVGFSSDMKVEIAKFHAFVYPDASVVCGKIDYKKGRTDVIKNPLLIVEVLSSSTESYDRGEKFQKYQSLSSFKEYVLVSQKEPKVEVFTRQDDKTWLYYIATGLETNIILHSISHEIQLFDIYRKIDFTVASE